MYVFLNYVDKCIELYTFSTIENFGVMPNSKCPMFFCQQASIVPLQLHFVSFSIKGTVNLSHWADRQANRLFAHPRSNVKS